MKLPGDLPMQRDVAELMRYWIDRGWAVFPLAPRSKEPLAGSNGVRDATRESATVASWAESVPNANIGGACDRWLVVDVDPRNGGVVPDWLPPTRVHMSGRGDGGCHLIYKLPPGAKVKSGKIAPGVDVKTGAGSYVVLPGSIHPDTGFPYVEGNQAMAVAPAALVSRVSREGSTDSENTSAPTNTRSILSALLENPAKEGGRNDWLATVCGHYAKQYRRTPDLYHTQVGLANNLLTPPLDEAEVRKTSQSIWDAEMTNNADRDHIDDLAASNGYLVGIGDRLMTLGWPDGAARDDPPELVEFADFNPRVVNVLVDPDDDMYIYDIELHRTSGDPVVITVTAESFGDPRTLRKVFARYAASVTHPKRLVHGSPDWATRLLKFLTSQNAPRLQKAPYLGWNDEEQGYLTMTGVLDASGLREFRVAKPNTVELRHSTPIDHEYRFESTRQRAVEILAEVCTFQDPETVAVFGAWWAGTLIKHQIRRHTALFPVMAVEAASGSGKTSGFFAMMAQLAGSNDGAGQYTLATLRNALSAHTNNIIWVDDLDDPSSLHEMIRVLTAGGSLSKMVNHTRTVRYPLVSSLLLSGESLGLADQQATLDRCILLHPPDPTRRMSLRGDYPQWDDVARLQAELHQYGGGSGVSGHYAQMVAQASGDIRVMCESLARSVPTGRTGAWYLTLAAGARVLDYLTTDDRSMLVEGNGQFAEGVQTWLTARLEPTMDDGGNRRDRIHNDNAMIQKILPMYLADVSVNPAHRSPVASIYQTGEDYEVLVNTRALAEWWSDQRHGRVHPRTESDSSFQQQVLALKNTYGDEVISHVRRRFGAGDRLRRFVRITGPVAREIVLRSQD